MKTYNIIFAVLAMAGLAVSCTKSGMGGETPLSEEETPVAVQLSTNIKVNEVSATKAGVDHWNAQKLYIYALPTNQIPAAESADILVDNAIADAPTDATTDPYVKKDIDLHKGESDFYYYPAGASTFDFFGYYVDNAAGDTPSPVITAGDKIVLPITLTGSQDIMLAKADKIADTEGKGIAPANAYSAYSARKHVKPNLIFQHQLSRFVFYVVAGNPGGANVRIDNVTLTSKSKADLVIASVSGATGITNATEDDEFELEGITDQPCYPARVVNTQESYVIDPSDRIGESIMVIPAPLHKMVMKMQQMNDAKVSPLGELFEYVYELTPSMVTNASAVTEFLPGYQYNVNVVVYGRQKVEVSVTLTEWAAGGSITIDNDTEWGDEPKLGLKATNAVGDEYYLYFYGNSNVIAQDMEVKYWDKNANKMVAPETGTYMFVTPVTGTSTIYGVSLTKTGDGENAKTTVTALVTEAPTSPTE